MKTIYPTSKMPCEYLHGKSSGSIIKDYGYEHNLAKAPQFCTSPRKTKLYISALSLEYSVPKKQVRKDLVAMGVTV